MKFVFDFGHDESEDMGLYGVLSKPMDEELSSMIRQQNVLVIEDDSTNGSTLNKVLRTLRDLNKDNNIAIFSIIE